MNAEYIERIFEDYLKTEDTQYAILINGTWGSGKTYFWKHKLESIASRKEKNFGFKTLYISLNGVSKIEELKHLMFLELLPFFKHQENPHINNFTKLLGNAAKVADEKLLNSALTKIFKDISVSSYNFSKSVICFDDLERCQIPIKEVLGFINDYVEHKKLKTIILADETQIDETQMGYDNIKEKVIGRILNYEPNIEEILPRLFKKYKAKSHVFFNFLENHENFIKDLLTEFGQKNLRIILFNLDALSKIFPFLNEIDQNHAQEIILFTLIVTIEFKEGRLTSKKLEENLKILESVLVPDTDYLSLSSSSKELTDTEIEEGKKKELNFSEEYLKRKYLKFRLKDYSVNPSIYNFIVTGYLNQEELNAEIKTQTKSKDIKFIPQEIQDFRKLIQYNFRELSDEEFDKLQKTVLENARLGIYSIYDYPSIANFYYYFSKRSLINESVKKIKGIIVEGLEISKDKFQIDDNKFDSLSFFKNENPDVDEIVILVKDIRLEKRKAQYKIKGEDFLKVLLQEDENEMATFFKKFQLQDSLFQYLDGKLFYETVLKASNKQLFYFQSLLEDRYNSVNIGDFLFKDFDSLDTLKNNLQEFELSEITIQPMRKFTIKNLIEVLEQVTKKLVDTKRN